jgi:hypothetical protein
MISSTVVSKDDFKRLLEDIGLQQMHVDRCADLVDAECQFYTNQYRYLSETKVLLQISPTLYPVVAVLAPVCVRTDGRGRHKIKLICARSC